MDPVCDSRSFVAMNGSIATICILLLIAAGTGCKKEQPDGYHAADITYRSDSGYTYHSDTVSVSDTLRIGVIITAGSYALRSFFVDVAYDGGAKIRQDSLPVGSNPFTFDKQVITRDQPGTETWWFTVKEYNGDFTTRNLVLTVQ